MIVSPLNNNNKIIVTNNQLRMYADYLQPGDVVIAPIDTNGDSKKNKDILGKECVVLNTYRNFAEVQGLHGEGTFSIKYIDLFTRNKIPQDILNAPIYAAQKEEEIISESININEPDEDE